MNKWLYIAVIICSVVLHEVSHGYVAYFFGDPTAKERHRLSLNPLRHIDPFGTVILPAMMILLGNPGIGYAKPVPVNVSRLRHPREDAVWVSLAGPAVNVVLSAVGYGICRYALTHGFLTISGGALHYSWTMQFGLALGLGNLILAVFNLMPIPPLDGAAVIERFIPRRSLSNYYQWQAKAMPFLLIGLVLFFAFSSLGQSWLIAIQSWWIGLL